MKKTGVIALLACVALLGCAEVLVADPSYPPPRRQQVDIPQGPLSTAGVIFRRRETPIPHRGTGTCSQEHHGQSLDGDPRRAQPGAPPKNSSPLRSWRCWSCS